MEYKLEIGLENSPISIKRRQPMKTDMLTTTQKAEKWYDALPLGNGHMGAMVMSKGTIDRLVINDECLWSGYPIRDNNRNARVVLDQVRQLIFNGNGEAAQKLMEENFLSQPPRLDSYEFLTNLHIDTGICGRIRGFRRTLNMETGVSTTRYTIGQDHFAQTYFISGADDIGVARYETTGRFDQFRLAVYRGEGDTACTGENGRIVLLGQLGDSYMVQRTKRMETEKWMRYGLALRIETDGKIQHGFGGDATIRGASTVTLYFTTKTDYDYSRMDYSRDIDCQAVCAEKLRAAEAFSYPALKKRAEQAFSREYRKVRLELAADGKAPRDVYAIIQAAKQGHVSNAAMVLYYNYSRYLLIAAGALQATLPANLQGIWCWETKAPWNSDFHTNINLQMNYWQADSVGLEQGIQVLTEFMEHMAKPGRDTAKDMYGARGWCIHHCVTPFGRTGLHDGLTYGILPLAGAWMMLHLFEHYEYSQDLGYLKRIYPLLAGCVDFICDFLVMGPEGKYVTAPSASPENMFVTPEGKASPLSYGCSMDLEIVFMTLSRFLYASRLLKKRGKRIDASRERLENLMPLQVSKRYGTIQEWIRDYEETEPGHRHVSHLIGLYPGDCINAQDSALYQAARNTIDRRVEHGALACNWSIIWGALFYARFWEGDLCCKLLKAYFQEYLRGAFFNVWFIGDYIGFQIDSMLGYAAVIHEMLIQSHEGRIGERIVRLLPALPAQWPAGSLCGIHARGGLTFDIWWEQGRLTRAAFVSSQAQTVRIAVENSGDYQADGEYKIIDGILHIPAEQGKTYTIKIKEPKGDA